ncbi:hypothetical protein HDU87_002320 [Geranomyces variabilis]|uniref:Transmembrane protein n=1 Tax=Geranomyces variabilis TaxID=109894 RepID=A0AAD5TNS1_9FUNG|nr:hypothetical protein HDU87_002320 [Geranomyces variabilis]
MSGSDAPVPSASLQAACGVGFLALNPGATPADAQAFCTQQFTIYGSGLAHFVSTSFGQPAIILGCCFPFLLLNLIIAISRLVKILNARSVFLMISTLGQLVFVASIAWALCDSNVDTVPSDYSGVIGITIMLIFVCVAGITRFSQVIVSTRRRHLLQRGSCAIVLAYGCLLCALAAKEVTDSLDHPTIFSKRFIGLFLVPVLIYLLGGLFCFSWNLPSAFPSRSNPSVSRAESPFAMLKTLRIVNDAMMFAVAAVCVSQLSVAFVLRRTVYGTAVICLHVSIILFIENIFETITNAIRGRGIFSGYTSNNPSDNHRGHMGHSSHVINSDPVFRTSGALPGSPRVEPSESGIGIAAYGGVHQKENWGFEKEAGSSVATVKYPPSAAPARRRDDDRERRR